MDSPPPPPPFSASAAAVVRAGPLLARRPPSTLTGDGGGACGAPRSSSKAAAVQLQGVSAFRGLEAWSVLRPAAAGGLLFLPQHEGAGERRRSGGGACASSSSRGAVVTALSLATSRPVARLVVAAEEGPKDEASQPEAEEEEENDGDGDEEERPLEDRGANRLGGRIVGAVAVRAQDDEDGISHTTQIRKEKEELWVGLESGVLCCYDLDEEAWGRRSSGLAAPPPVPPSRKLALVWGDDDDDEEEDKEEEAAIQAGEGGEEEGEDKQEEEDRGGEGEGEGGGSDRDRGDADGPAADGAPKQEKDEPAKKKKKTKKKSRREKAGAKSKMAPAATSSPAGLRLHHLALTRGRNLVGYALVSRESGPGKRGGGGGSPDWALARFVVPPPPPAGDAGAGHLRRLPVTVVDAIAADRRPLVPFDLLSAAADASPAAESSSSTRRSVNAVLVASPSALAVYCDDDGSDAGDSHQEEGKGDERDAARGSGRRASRPVAIHHPKRRTNRLACVAVGGGPQGGGGTPLVAAGYWNGEIRVWPTLLDDVVRYHSDLARYRRGAAGDGKPAHPAASSRSIRLHWHAHPVSSVAFDPANPSVLYSGGEEGVLCVWDWTRSVQVSNVLPRVSAGPIVHLAAAAAAGSAGSAVAGIGSREPRVVVHTSDNALRCVLPHNLSTLWRVASLAAEPLPAGPLDAAAEEAAWPPPPPRRPVVLCDPAARSLLLLGLPRSPSLCQEWSCARRELDRSWPVAPHNRVSRRDWDDPDVEGPSVACAAAAGSVLVTVDRVPTENAGIGRGGSAVTLKFWARALEDGRSGSGPGGSRNNARFVLECAMAFPHGSLSDVSAVAVSPDGNSAATVSNEEKAWRLWRRTGDSGMVGTPSGVASTPAAPASWACVYRVEVPLGLSSYDVSRDAVAFSADSTVLAMAHGSLVSLWDVDNTALVGTLEHWSSGDWTDAAAKRRNEHLSAAVEPVESLQFTSVADMILSVSASSVVLQSPYSSGPLGVREGAPRGWVHRARSGSRITCAGEVPSSAASGAATIAVATYAPLADASAIDLLDARTGVLLWSRSGWSGSVLAVSALPRTVPTAAGSPRTSAWDAVPDLVPADPSAVRTSSVQPPFLREEPAEILFLDSHGQLLSLCEEAEADSSATAAAVRVGALVDGTESLSGPKIALFEDLRHAGPLSASRKRKGRAPVLSWSDLASAASSAGRARRRSSGGDVFDSDGDADDGSGTEQGLWGACDAEAESGAAAPPPRLGSAWVRSFVTRSLRR